MSNKLKKEILEKVLEGVAISTWNTAINNNNPRILFYNRKNTLMYKYCGGSELKFGLMVSEVLGDFVSQSDQIKCSKLSDKINRLAKRIKLKRKYKHLKDLSEMIDLHNSMVEENNEIAKGYAKLRRLFKKINNYK